MVQDNTEKGKPNKLYLGSQSIGAQIAHHQLNGCLQVNQDYMYIHTKGPLLLSITNLKNRLQL